MSTVQAASEQNQPPQPPARPKLALYLEELGQCVRELTTATQLYQHMKQVMQQAHEHPDHVALAEISLQMCLGDLVVPVPMPQDQQQRISYIEEGTSFLGEDVIRLWGVAHRLTTEANQHCAAAARRAAEQQQPQPPVAPPDPPG